MDTTVERLRAHHYYRCVPVCIRAYLSVVSSRVRAYPCVFERIRAYPSVSGRIRAYLSVSVRIRAYLSVSERIRAFPCVSVRIRANPCARTPPGVLSSAHLQAGSHASRVRRPAHMCTAMRIICKAPSMRTHISMNPQAGQLGRSQARKLGRPDNGTCTHMMRMSSRAGIRLIT
jgi:hypothetical protein